MFKFVAVSLVALSLAACGSKEEEVVAPAAEAAPAVEAAPAAEVPAEGVSATAVAVPAEPNAAADAGAVAAQ